MRKLLCFALLCVGISASAQLSNVTGTVTDTDNQKWNNGAYQITFVPPTGYTGSVYTFNGSSWTPTVHNGVMSGSGVLTYSSLERNDYILPANSHWKFTVCPNASFPCTSRTVTINQASQDISSQFNAVQAPRFAASNAQTGSFGYLDVEVSPATPPVGSSYFNVTLNQPKLWNGTTWQTGGGGSATPGGTSTNVQFNDSGVLGGNGNFTFDKNTGIVNIDGVLGSSVVTIGPHAPPASSWTLDTYSPSAAFGSIVPGATVTGTGSSQVAQFPGIVAASAVNPIKVGLGTTPLTADDTCSAGNFWIAPVLGSVNAWRMCNNGTVTSIGTAISGLTSDGSQGITVTNNATIGGTIQGVKLNLTNPTCVAGSFAKSDSTGCGVGGVEGTQNAVFQQALSSAVLVKGGSYGGWTADAFAAPAFCWDGTRYVMTVSLWSIANAKWASAAFSSPDLKTWSYIASSLQSPTGSDYIWGNSGLAYYHGTYYIAYTHYPSVATSRGVVVATSSNLTTWTTAYTVTAGVSEVYGDPSLNVNPNTGKLELWMSHSPSNQFALRTFDGTTWTDLGDQVAFPSDYAGGGEPSTWYSGTRRYVSYDAQTSGNHFNGFRITKVLYSDSPYTTYFAANFILNSPNTGAAWQSAQVFDASVLLADTEDGQGLVPRVLWAGGDVNSSTDNTDSSIGYSYAPVAYASLYVATPSSYSSSGSAGQYAVGGGYIYNYDQSLTRWQRVAVDATWGAPQVLDYFAGSVSTQLTTHTTTGSQPWVGWAQHSGDLSTWTTVQLSGSGTVSNSSATQGSLYVNMTPSSASYTVCATGISNGKNFGVGEVSTSADTGYRSNFGGATSSGTMTLYAANAGTYTSKGTSAFTWTGSHTQCLVRSGTSISVTIDGATVIGPVTDSTYTSVGVPLLTIGQSSGVTVSQFVVQ
jgi:hypothetical protein